MIIKLKMGRMKPEKKNTLLWATVLVQFAYVTGLNVTANTSSESLETSITYAWSSWGSWSACSKTCGGGVAIQERQCLPRSTTTAPDGTLPPPIITVRVTRQTHAGDCPGVARRYHECNTAPCPEGERDSRAEQCAAYDRRPFRGRFYTWVPYIDGDSPCTLNCRPLGQQFYASLALVADGTSCTKPGYRAICVQGECKIVGRETVLGVASNKELRCGRRLVSGLFSRPRLPLGYSYVTTVPRGACRLNISEIIPNDNYIALKISNSSYIMNGEFAVSAPGTYDAAGARFIYSRIGGLDSVYAMGPIHHPIDIMVLYTQPNPSIKYEYFTEAISTDVDNESATSVNTPDPAPPVVTKHTRRHHSFDSYPRPSIAVPRYPEPGGVSKETSGEEDLEENIVGTRKFIWKITTYSQCTRSCGGGFQLGKFRCVEIFKDSDKEVSPVHCPGSAPAGKRRRCNNIPCPPRWRAASWSTCPQCGPATRTRIVGCVQDHFRGITKISDQKCPGPKPPTTEVCDIPNCEGVEHVEARILRTRDHTDTFRDGPVYSVPLNSSDLDVGPEYSFSNTAGWLTSDWSDCVGWCVGGGIQSRGVRCADPAGCPKKAPEASRSCSPKIICEPHDGRWFTGEWSPCSSSCGGRQVRGVLCIGGSGRHLRDSACKMPRPDHERDCGEDCVPTWFTGDWDQCTGNCSSGTGIQRRSVVCMKSENKSQLDCGDPKPSSQRFCELKCPEVDAFPPDLTIESQKIPILTTSQPTPIVTTTARVVSTGCEDKLNNCVLAVQARLCHYNYYIQNCCNSCSGR